MNRATEFDGADAHVLTDELLAAATNLRWVQSWSAGVDRYLKLDGLRESEQIVLTNMQGAYGPVIAEHVFGMLLSLTRKLPQLEGQAQQHAEDVLLSLTRKLPQLEDAQEEGVWDRGRSEGATSLAGRTMFVVGMGGIGSEIARRAHGFDMKVLATVRNPEKRKKPDYVSELGGTGDLDDYLSRSDVVVVALPLTDETRGLFDASKFARMPEGSWFVNIGRGPIVVTDDLVSALRGGHLAGAGLDVTDPEPLPEGHALWSMPNVVITPHVSARAELSGERRWEVLQKNMQAFGAGEPLINVVDKKRGY